MSRVKPHAFCEPTLRTSDGFLLSPGSETLDPLKVEASSALQDPSGVKVM